MTEKPQTNPSRKAAGWLACCIAVVGGFEGLRTVAYRDPVGIPTICFGETRGVRMGDRATVPECKEMLGERLLEFSNAVDSCLHHPLTDGQRVAFVSLAYNIGTGAFCRSSVAAYARRGEMAAACEAIMRFRYAKGVPLPGLTRRRKEERAICLG